MKYKTIQSKSYLPVEIAYIWCEGICEKGNVRAQNEDYIFLDKQGKYVLLADGIGGHEKGHIASKSAISTIKSILRKKNIIKKELKDNTHEEDLPIEIIRLSAIVEKAVAKANAKIYKKNQNLIIEKRMGTTIVGAIFNEGGNILWFHIGDSRIYRYRNSILGCLTVDHSAYMDWIAKNDIFTDTPNRNIITKAIGIEEDISVDINWGRVKNNDIYILCSDGIYDVLNDCQISEIVSSSNNYKNISNLLISTAIDAGSRDNLSVIVCMIKYIYN